MSLQPSTPSPISPDMMIRKIDSMTTNQQQDLLEKLSAWEASTSKLQSPTKPWALSRRSTSGSARNLQLEEMPKSPSSANRRGRSNSPSALTRRSISGPYVALSNPTPKRRSLRDKFGLSNPSHTTSPRPSVIDTLKRRSFPFLPLAPNLANEGETNSEEHFVSVTGELELKKESRPSLRRSSSKKKPPSLKDISLLDKIKDLEKEGANNVVDMKKLQQNLEATSPSSRRRRMYRLGNTSMPNLANTPPRNNRSSHFSKEEQIVRETFPTGRDLSLASTPLSVYNSSRKKKASSTEAPVKGLTLSGGEASSKSDLSKIPLRNSNHHKPPKGNKKKEGSGYRRRKLPSTSDETVVVANIKSEKLVV